MSCPSTQVKVKSGVGVGVRDIDGHFQVLVVNATLEKRGFRFQDGDFVFHRDDK